MKSFYSLNLKKILWRNLRNILIAFGILAILRILEEGNFLSVLNRYSMEDGIFPAIVSVISAGLVIAFFPFILFLDFFLCNWILEILDVLLFWVKTIDTETKTINSRIRYEDFYLLDYRYSITERHKNSIWALLILTADKKTKLKILCEAETFADAPAECKEFIEYCQKQKRIITQKSKRMPSRNKVVIGKRSFTNRSFYGRIFMRYVVWTALYLAIILSTIGFVLSKTFFK